MRPTIVIAGPASATLAAELAALCQFDLTVAMVRTFPDGEVLTSVPDDLRGRKVVVVQGTHPPQDRNLQHLYQLVEVASAAGAHEICCVVPYLAYARQDRRALPGQALSSAIIPRCLAALGAASLICVEPHNPATYASAPLSFEPIGVAEPISEYLRSVGGLMNPVVVSPDRGGAVRSRLVADHVGCELLTLSKSKDETGLTWYESQGHALEGRDVLVVDDLCSSGSTLLPLSSFLDNLGARHQLHLFAHFLGDYNAVQSKLVGNSKIVACNTIDGPASSISVTQAIAATLRRARL